MRGIQYVKVYAYINVAGSKWIPGLGESVEILMDLRPAEKVRRRGEGNILNNLLWVSPNQTHIPFASGPIETLAGSVAQNLLDEASDMDAAIVRVRVPGVNPDLPIHYADVVVKRGGRGMGRKDPPGGHFTMIKPLAGLYLN